MSKTRRYERVLCEIEVLILSDNLATQQWYSIIVRKSTIKTLATQYSLSQLEWLHKGLTGRIPKTKNIMKLARLTKDAFVRRYADTDITSLIYNISGYSKVHLVTFQRREVYNDIERYGVYTPNPRFGTEPETELVIADRLGYFPVWYVNPLVLGQSNIDIDAFCLRSFMGYYETAFPFHKYDISNDYYLFEIETDVSVITESNSSYICTCLPDIRMENLIGVYAFYRNDPDCGLPNTQYEPYIKVVNTYSDNAMCSKDYAAALEYETYTGTDADFDL